MKHFPKLSILLVLLFLTGQHLFSQAINYSDSWGQQGLTLVNSRSAELQIIYSLETFQFGETIINGESLTSVQTPGVFLPNEAGAPDLPVTSRYVAIPNGATARVNIIASRTELFKDIDVAPAPEIPFDTEDGPLKYKKDQGIYARDAFYPEAPVMLSEPLQIRGIDAVILSISPFQYNPVTKELIVYRDLKIEIETEGGNGRVGEDRLRSRFWDPIASTTATRKRRPRSNQKNTKKRT